MVRGHAVGFAGGPASCHHERMATQTSLSKSDAARKLAALRKNSGRPRVERFQCLQCDAKLCSVEVRSHKCRRAIR